MVAQYDLQNPPASMHLTPQLPGPVRLHCALFAPAHVMSYATGPSSYSEGADVAETDGKREEATAAEPTAA